MNIQGWMKAVQANGVSGWQTVTPVKIFDLNGLYRVCRGPVAYASDIDQPDQKNVSIKLNRFYPPREDAVNSSDDET